MDISVFFEFTQRYFQFLFFSEQALLKYTESSMNSITIKLSLRYVAVIGGGLEKERKSGPASPPTPPRIISPPLNLDIAQGKNVTLPCQVIL